MRLYRFVLFVTLWMVTGALTVLSIPSYPHSVRIAVGNGYADIYLHGDEHFKYGNTIDGYTILSFADNWYYAMEDDNGNVVPSNFKLVPYGGMDEETQHFLNKTKKGLVIENELRNVQHASVDRYDNKEKKPAIGTRKVLVILMQFQDRGFTKSKVEFDRLFNEQNYREDGAIGSVHDYYNWASYGQLNLQSDIVGPYTADHTMSYYGGNSGIGGNDINPYELFCEAINYAEKEVNLSDYDTDEDGYVDNIHIIYAGYGEEAGASPNAIWAHEMTFRTITIQGMKIDRYSCAPELRENRGNGISRIGPHCHEIGHALGAMDFYDTDYKTGGEYSGTGKWDIMASGSWNNDGIAPADFNPYVKVYNFGWTEAKSLVLDTINAIGVSSEIGNIYRVNTGTNNDYFLLENRDQQGFHSAEPGKGLLIFHIGPNLETRASTNTINSTYPQQCYVVCASSTYKTPSKKTASYGDINSAGCPYPGTTRNTDFNETSIPAALTVSGHDTGINISGIRYDGDIIVFQYGKSKNDEPDNPGETTTPPDDVYLWGEDFEQLRLPSSWNYTNIKNSGEIKVVTKLLNNDSPQSPIADSGIGYARFVGLSQSIIGKYKVSGQLMSPLIHLAEGNNYVLSFSVRKYNKSSSIDNIMVTLFNEDGNSEYEIANESVEDQKAWVRYSVDIPDNYHRFLVGIQFDIDYGTVLFLDNITISGKQEVTDVNNTPRLFSGESPSAIFTLMGLRKQNSTHGINIVKMPDNTYKKVLIK